MLGFPERHRRYTASSLYTYRKELLVLGDWSKIALYVSAGLSDDTVEPDEICATNTNFQLAKIAVGSLQNTAGLISLRLPLHATICVCSNSQWTSTNQETLHACYTLNGVWICIRATCNLDKSFLDAVRAFFRQITPGHFVQLWLAPREFDVEKNKKTLVHIGRVSGLTDF